MHNKLSNVKMASDYKLVLMEKLIQIHKTIPELMCTKTIQKQKQKTLTIFKNKTKAPINKNPIYSLLNEEIIRNKPR